MKPPAPGKQRPAHDQRRNATSALAAWRCVASGLLIAIGMVVSGPAHAAAASAGSESVPTVAIAAGLGLAVALLVASAAAVITLLRRSRYAANEARRLNALLDVLDEGVAVCTGMQAVAVNTSLCRLIGIEHEEAPHLMISSFIGDADVIERLLGEGELRLDTDVINRAGAMVAVEIAARTIAYGEGVARLLEFRDVG